MQFSFCIKLFHNKFIWNSLLMSVDAKRSGRHSQLPENQNQNSLLVKRQTDNTTPGGMGLDRRGLVPSSHKRSKFRHTII